MVVVSSAAVKKFEVIVMESAQGTEQGTKGFCIVLQARIIVEATKTVSENACPTEPLSKKTSTCQ